jgi:hypothetical protein
MPDDRSTRKGGKYSTGEYTVTTILGIIDKPALTAWLKKQVFNAAINGVTDYSEALAIVKKISKDAMDIGTRVHEYVQFYGTDVIPPKYDDCKGYYDAYHEWIIDYSPELIENEVTVTSKVHGYKGTLDKIVRIDGKLVLVDLKTGKYVYESVELQASAYKQAWEEEHPGQVIDELRVLLLEKGDDGLPTGKYKYELLNYRPDIFNAAFEVFKWSKEK